MSKKAQKIVERLVLAVAGILVFACNGCIMLASHCYGNTADYVLILGFCLGFAAFGVATFDYNRAYVRFDTNRKNKRVAAYMAGIRADRKAAQEISGRHTKLSNQVRTARQNGELASRSRSAAYFASRKTALSAYKSR